MPAKDRKESCSGTDGWRAVRRGTVQHEVFEDLNAAGGTAGGQDHGDVDSEDFSEERDPGWGNLPVAERREIGRASCRERV